MNNSHIQSVKCEENNCTDALIPTKISFPWNNEQFYS